jgi:aspartyl-tRNA(Asn)/glutamyl-tRNA(Gln) amidotransferase subunit A
MTHFAAVIRTEEPLMCELTKLTAAELVAGYRRRSFSPVEVVEAVYARIESVNRKLNAYYVLNEAEARETARKSEARWVHRSALSILDGVPISIKDQIYVKGMKSLLGTTLLGDTEATFDAPTTRRLREAGAVIIGKTTMPELGVAFITQSGQFGVTKNPWSLAHTPGGSSGGASAAVAGHLAPLAVGTDGAGSVRVPCSFTNIFGLKGTHGRIPHFPSPNDRTVVGPMARTVEDGAMLMSVIAQSDARDWTALPSNDANYLAAIAESRIAGLRIAYAPDLAGFEPDGDILRVMEDAVRVLSGLGAVVTEVDPICGSTYELWLTLAGPRYAFLLDGKTIEALEPSIQEIVNFGRSVTPRDTHNANEARLRLYDSLNDVFTNYDAIITPVTPVPPMPIGQYYPYGNRLRDGVNKLGSCTSPFSLSQQPAASVPAGFTSDGLPVGLQVACPKFADALVFRICHAFETVTQYWKRSPS